MRNILSITKKELKSYYNSPAAYIIMILFLLITGWFFTSTFFLEDQASMRNIFGMIPFIYLFFIPAITMKSLSEEKKTGTLELLVTLPVNDYDIVIGKILASFILVLSATAGTLIYAFTIGWLGEPDTGLIFTGYLGLVLISLAYTSIGVMASSLTDNSIVAFIISFFVLFILFLLGKVIVFVPGFLAGIFEYVSLDSHFNNIQRGVIDSRDIIYFLSLLSISALISVKTLEKRKS